MSEHLVITLLKYLVGIVIPLVIPVVVRFFLVKRRVSTLWTVVIVVTNFILMFAVVNIGSGRPPSFLEAFLYLLVPMAIVKGQYGKKDAHSQEEQASRKKEQSCGQVHQTKLVQMPDKKSHALTVINRLRPQPSRGQGSGGLQLQQGQ